jgi:hypothetical protein
LWLIATPTSPPSAIRHSLFASRRCFPSWLIALWQTQGSAPTICYSLFAIRYSLPFDQSLIANRQSLPFDQSPIANRQSLPFCYSLPLRDCDKFWGGGA